MKEDNLLSEKELKKRMFARGLLFGLLLLTFLCAILFTSYNFIAHQIKKEIDKSQTEEVRSMSAEIRVLLSGVGSDLNYLCKNKMSREYLAIRDSDNSPNLISLMSLLAGNNNSYDQVRLIDTSGQEILRVNNKNNTVKIVPKSKLQNKANRYYVTETMKLDSGQSYISDFDLNIENGKIEIPLKPMIRYAQQVYDDSGAVVGMGILNYLGDNIINQLIALNKHEGDQVYLLNKTGNYILGPQKDSEWAWMYPDEKRSTFSKEYPIVWAKCKETKQGQEKHKSGTFYFARISTSPSDKLRSTYGEDLTIVMFVPKKVINEKYAAILPPFIFGIIIFGPLLTFLGIRIGMYQVNQKWLYRKILMQATLDQLTGLFNRRAIQEKLYTEIRLSRRRNAELALSFIDVNNLKVINDTQGHDAGDILIKGAADALVNIIRETDYAARLGGDEFLVVFPDCNRKGAESIMKRINDEFRLRGLSTMDTPWSLSYGCAELQENDSAEELIRRADLRMYKHKMEQKAGIDDNA